MESMNDLIHAAGKIANVQSKRTQRGLTSSQMSERFNKDIGDLRANGNLFCNLCLAAVHNGENIKSEPSSIYNRSKISEMNLKSFNAPESIQESIKVSENLDAMDVRIFTETGGSMVVATYHPPCDGKEGIIIPKAFGEFRSVENIFWIHDSNDSYRFVAENIEEAKQMYVDQVPEERRQKDFTIDIEESTRTTPDHGSPFMVKLEYRDGRSKVIPGFETFSSAMSICVMEKADISGFTIKDKSKKTAVKMKYKSEVGNPKSTMPSIKEKHGNEIDNAIKNGKMAIVNMAGDDCASALSDLLGYLGVTETHVRVGETVMFEQKENGAIKEFYGIVMESGNGYYAIDILTQGLTHEVKANARIIEYVRHEQQMLAENHDGIDEDDDIEQKAALMSDVMIRQYGMEEAMTRTQKKLDDYIKNFPDNKSTQAFYTTSLNHMKRIKNASRSKSESSDKQ